MKYYFQIFLLFFVLLVSISCKKDFEKINTNPNVPLKVSSGLLLPNIIRDAVNRNVLEGWSIGNIVIQHIAKIQFVNEDRYIWGERNDIWNTGYATLKDVYNMHDLASASGDNNYKAISLIMKSWIFSVLTDAYGDIPYSQAIKGKTEENFTPVYDSQEEIYNGILADLKTANELMGTSTESITGDILFAGNQLKWKKLANSLRLRYLMRISGKKASQAQAEMSEILGDPEKYPVFSSIADNAALKYLDAFPSQWPLYTSRVGSFDEYRASNTMVDTLSSLNDPRLPVFARPTQSSISAGAPKYVGVPNGLNDVDALVYNGGVQNISRVGLTFACDACDDGTAPMVAYPNAAEGIIMTYQELQFILAEAKEKGLITNGLTAQEYYLNGVRASFDYFKSIVPTAYGLTLDPPAEYFTQKAVAYEGSNMEKLEKIALQKWVALFFNGMEAWFDWRRTGLPMLKPGIANDNGNKIPVRFRYPTIEQSLNGANLNAAISRQGPDDLNTKVWWQK